MSKQAYFKYDDNRALARAAREAFAVEYVRSVRAVDSGIGGQKLYVMYRSEMAPQGELVGRDTFYRLIDENNLKIRQKRRKPRTTDSTHGLPTFPNLTKEFIPTAPNQLWVSDITYIEVWNGDKYYFVYLSLILDAYTKEIIGWSAGPDLSTVYPMEALRMALKRLECVDKSSIRLIHHSDRGVQYASRNYVKLLQDWGISISMTESGNPKDNPQAERINNTMKNELLKGIVFHNIAEVVTAVEKAVDFYNNRRPHMSINNMTPAQAALCSGEIKKLWHSWREDAIKRNSAEKLENPSVIPGNCLPLPSVLGSPSGLRPSVNPRTE
jgi:transposase InsO family protein